MGGVLILPLFGCYLFVRFDVRRDSWRRVAHTKGVRRLFGATPDDPTPIADQDVEDLKHGEQARLVIRFIEPTPPREGQPIKVIAGPFKGKSGICRRVVRMEVVALLFLDRGPTEVTMPAKWCVAA